MPGTAQHPMQARAAPMYLPHHQNAVAFAAFPVLMHHGPPPPKRPLEAADDEGASRSKKARGKAKAPESNGNGASSRRSPPPAPLIAFPPQAATGGLRLLGSAASQHSFRRTAVRRFDASTRGDVLMQPQATW